MNSLQFFCLNRLKTGNSCLQIYRVSQKKCDLWKIDTEGHLVERVKNCPIFEKFRKFPIF